MDLLDKPLLTTISSHKQLKSKSFSPQHILVAPLTPHGQQIENIPCRSTDGIVFSYDGGAIYSCSCIHPTVAQSSTKAELAFLTNASRKAALYLQSILEELQLEQLCPTDIKVDNRGAQQLTNAQQPSRLTQHISMRYFCILQWTEEELILFTDIPTAYKVSNSISKPMGHAKFYKHMDIMMGRRKPTYVPYNPNNPSSPLKPHISSTCSSLQELTLSNLLDYKDLDNLVSFDDTSVGGGVRGMTHRTKPTLNIQVTMLVPSPLEHPSSTTPFWLPVFWGPDNQQSPILNPLTPQPCTP
jgi:hypothetical protein